MVKPREHIGGMFLTQFSPFSSTLSRALLDSRNFWKKQRLLGIYFETNICVVRFL